MVEAVSAHSEVNGAIMLVEGIEDESQLALARGLGAELGQGFLFGPAGRAAGPAARGGSSSR